MFKSSTVKSLFFEEVQEAYGLKKFKLAKAVGTWWLLHRKPVNRVLDRSETLVAALEGYVKGKMNRLLGKSRNYF